MNHHNTSGVTLPDIVAGLRALGVTAGDVLLVHSSLRSFGAVEGGASAVIDALLAAVAPGGTVLVPTLTGRRQDGPADPPVFDVRSSPCWTGVIPETFRQRSEARRSLHPTHSVAAIGPHTDSLLAGHLQCATPCGPGSPYLQLAERGGKVVFLGVDLNCCTLLHSVEELAECAYHLQPEPALATITNAEGQAFRQSVRLHDWGTPRAFTRVEPELRAAGLLRLGTLGAATVRVLDARAAVGHVLTRLRDQPRYLCRELELAQPQPE